MFNFCQVYKNTFTTVCQSLHSKRTHTNELWAIWLVFKRFYLKTIIAWAHFHTKFSFLFGIRNISFKLRTWIAKHPAFTHLCHNLLLLSASTSSLCTVRSFLFYPSAAFRTLWRTVARSMSVTKTASNPTSKLRNHCVLV